MPKARSFISKKNFFWGDKGSNFEENKKLNLMRLSRPLLVTCPILLHLGRLFACDPLAALLQLVVYLFRALPCYIVTGVHLFSGRAAHQTTCCSPCLCSALLKSLLSIVFPGPPAHQTTCCPPFSCPALPPHQTQGPSDRQLMSAMPRPVVKSLYSAH